MWGGKRLPRVVHYKQKAKEAVKDWNASEGLTAIRQGALIDQAKPWVMNRELHKRKRILKDHECAQILHWTADYITFEPNPHRKVEVMTFVREMMWGFVEFHRVGQHTYNSFFRCCETMGDVALAYHFLNARLEADGDPASVVGRQPDVLARSDEKKVTQAGPNASAHPPASYCWILRIAAACRSPQVCEDVAYAVKDVCDVRPEMMSSEMLRYCFKELVAPVLRRELPDSDLLPEIEAMPSPSATLLSFDETRYDHQSSGDHPAAELERSFRTDPVCYHRPRIKGSMLTRKFNEELLRASTKRDINGVAACLQRYLEAQRNLPENFNRRDPANGVFLHHEDVFAFRSRLPRDGFPAEMYHYLVVAQCPDSMSTAIETLKKMFESRLLPLDTTLAVVFAALKTTTVQQLMVWRWFNECGRTRDQWGYPSHTEETGEGTIACAYWEYDMTKYIQYRNAMSWYDFFTFVLPEVGLKQLIRVLKEDKVVDDTKDLPVLSEEFAEACEKYGRTLQGEPAEVFLDDVTTEAPLLDIALVNALSGFSNYKLVVREVASSLRQLGEWIAQFSTILVYDTSFFEAHSGSWLKAVDFVPQQQAPGDSRPPLALIPYFCIRSLSDHVYALPCTDTQIAEDAERAKADSALLLTTLCAAVMASQQAVGGEQVLALDDKTDRDALLSSRIQTHLLHFTECMLARGGAAAEASPIENDNDWMVACLQMLASLMAKHASESKGGQSIPQTLVLCTEDPRLEEAVRGLKLPFTVLIQTTPDKLPVEAKEEGLTSLEEHLARIEVGEEAKPASEYNPDPAALNAMLDSNFDPILTRSIKRVGKTETVEATSHSPPKPLVELETVDPFAMMDVMDDEPSASDGEQDSERADTNQRAISGDDYPSRLALLMDPLGPEDIIGRSQCSNGISSSPSKVDEELLEGLKRMEREESEMMTMASIFAPSSTKSALVEQMEARRATTTGFFDVFEPPSINAERKLHLSRLRRSGPVDPDEETPKDYVPEGEGGVGVTTRHDEDSQEQQPYNQLKLKFVEDIDRDAPKPVTGQIKEAFQKSSGQGAKVPLDLTFRVERRNINDPRNARYRKAYEAIQEKKRTLPTQQVPDDPERLDDGE